MENVNNALDNKLTYIDYPFIFTNGLATQTEPEGKNIIAVVPLGRTEGIAVSIISTSPMQYGFRLIGSSETVTFNCRIWYVK